MERVVGPGRERNVERGAQTLTHTALARGAGAGIERVLVHAGVEDVAARLEDVLRPVPVMYVEVDDRDLRRGVLASQVFRGDRRVVEEAETHGQRALGVMPRRTDRRERRAPAAGERPVAGSER